MDQQNSYQAVIVVHEMHAVCHTCIFVGCCLATKVFISKLPARGGVWVIIG